MEINWMMRKGKNRMIHEARREKQKKEYKVDRSGDAKTR